MTSPVGDFDRATSCSPPPRNASMRQTVPTQNKGMLCRHSPIDENTAWHWALRGGICNKYGDPMLESFVKSEGSRPHSKKASPLVTAPEKQASEKQAAPRRRSPERKSPDNSGDDVPKGVILVPAGAAGKRTKLRRALRTKLAECETWDELQTTSREIVEVISRGYSDNSSTHAPFLDLLNEAMWIYQPDVVQQVWWSAVHQVVEQEIQRRKRSLSLVKQESVRKGQVSEQPSLHRSYSTKSARDSHQSLDTGIQAEVDEVHASKERYWKTCFGRLSCGARLRVDDVTKALELCGVSRPQARFVEESIIKVTKSQALSCEEFIRVVHLYLERQRLEYSCVFKKFDTDGSKTIDVDELAEVLKAFSMEPLQYVLDDLISEIDKDGSGRVELNEFIELLELFEMNEGFSIHERQQFEEFFTRLDQNGDGLISTDLLGEALGWLGYSLKENDVFAIAKQVDIDSSGTLDWNEFLRCMRKVREKEIKILREALIEYDTDQSNSIGLGELESLLASLGMICDQEAVMDAAEDSGANTKEMDLNDLWKFLHLYRTREGLSREECAEVDAAFERYDSEKMEEINVVDLGKALRWFGYQVSFEVQQQLTEMVDVDRSGRLNKQEFRKMIRLYWEGELKRMRDAFAGQLETTSSMLTVEQAAKAFRRLDFVDDARNTPMVPSGFEAGIELPTFMYIGIKYKKAMRDVFRQNAGYTQQETTKMQYIFNEYDDDRSDSIGTNELGNLIQTIFPVMNLSVRSKLDLLMKEIDADGPGTGRLSFEDFLRTMRQFHDIQNQERVDKELRVVEGTKFNPQEVQGFRDIFLVCDTNHDSQLTAQEIKMMLQSVCPLGDKNLVLLERLVQEVRTQEKVTLKANLDLFDFPEFLLLMRKMIDVNFANLKERLSICC